MNSTEEISRYYKKVSTTQGKVWTCLLSLLSFLSLHSELSCKVELPIYYCFLEVQKLETRQHHEPGGAVLQHLAVIVVCDQSY